MPTFSWQYRYTLAELTFRRVRLLIYRLAAIVAFATALVAFAVFALRSYALLLDQHLLVFVSPNPGARFFWLAIIIVAYAWYRVEREQAWYPTLPRDATSITIDRYFSEELWRVLERAYRYADKLKQGAVMPLHLLAAALSYDTGQRVFMRLGTDIDKLTSTLRHALGSVPPGKRPKLAAESEQVFAAAAELAVKRQAHQVEVSELMLALVHSETAVRDVFEELAIPPQAVDNITAWFSLRQKILRERRRRSRRAATRPRHALDRSYLAVATPLLNRLSRDLTLQAANGYLAPCVGRQSELTEIYRIIEGGRESVALVGEPGVGKGSLLEGMAQAMVADEVPELLQDKHLMALSVPQLMSGVASAEAGERLLRVVRECLRAGNIVLAIEDVQQLLAPAGGGQGELSVADVLVNAMTKYGLVVVATVGKAEWRGVVERTALGQALQPVEVPEFDDDRAIQVLESRVPMLEHEHQVFFSYGALAAAVVLSRKYMPDRFLPEKALKLVEEVAIFARDKKVGGAAVSAEDVAQVMASKVHVPVTQVTQSESQKLLNLEEILHQRIIGQDEAVTLVSQALRRARVNLRDQKRPMASFLFLGPTGVGKTELAKTVAAEYFGGEEKMVRLDMSEYQTAESLYRLVGAPATTGQTSGLLTEAVRRSPYSLVLLDEIEKAHLDILNVFLQLLDDGRLTDASGRTVDFTNCIIIATSNAGTPFIQAGIRDGVPLEKIRKALLEQELQQYFRPEFLNRFDGVVVFKPLSSSDVEKVAELLISKVAFGLEAKGIHLMATPAAIRELALKGFDPLFGARPLRRVIQENVDNALATYLLSGKLTRRDVVVLEPGGVVRVEKAERL